MNDETLTIKKSNLMVALKLVGTRCEPETVTGDDGISKEDAAQILQLTKRCLICDLWVCAEEIKISPDPINYTELCIECYHNEGF